MTEDDLEQRLAAVLERARGPAQHTHDSRQDEFLRAAAVLWSFDPRSLRPDGQEADKHEVFERLSNLVVRLRGKASVSGWTLLDALRPRQLAKRAAEELKRLRALYSGPVAPEQELVDRWLVGRDPELADYDLDRLAVVSRVRSWFDSVPAWFPSEQEVEQLRAAARFRIPLEGLVGKAFCGRGEELAKIRAFVKAAPQATPALLVIHGIGGVGKSTLTAKILLDIEAQGEPSHLLAYLDFDLPTLDISDGVSLMLEIAAQCAAQRPDLPAIKLIADRAAQATIDLAAGQGRAPGRALAVGASMRELAEALGATLRDAGVTRVTVVFDTFEEIQYANADHQRFLEEQLGVLHHHLPCLSTLLVSRAPIALPGAVEMELGELDDDASRAYLAANGVDDPEHVALALEVAQRNPLSLKLASEVLRRAGELNVEPTRGGLEQEMVQGKLYRRILQHVHEQDVQQLAHPGLVVRRVTAEIIRLVLAEPCGLGALDEGQARALFDKLAREISLVRVAKDGALEHRADVRRVMLKLLYRDRPALAREIHERAARYYAQRSDVISVSEEAYHRFALGETSGEWLSRLSPEAAARLRNALEELPEHVWPTVASYAGIDLPEARWNAASQADRERRVAERLRELLAKDHVEQAVQLLAQNPPSGPNSALWRPQGRAFAIIGRLPEALEALERSLATLAGPEDEAREDARIAAEVAEKLGRRQRSNQVAEPPVSAPVAHSASAPLELPSLTSDSGGAGLLDAQELRELVQRTIVAVPRALGLESAARAMSFEHQSTNAARIYAEVIRLNQTPRRDDGSLPLLEWVENIYGHAHNSLVELKASLNPDLPEGGET